MVNNFFVINDNLITTNLLIYNNHELITILSDYIRCMSVIKLFCEAIQLSLIKKDLFLKADLF